jgi:glyoxylase-like metal-dependent hydrolase (beta-lactamase superfamily II)
MQHFHHVEEELRRLKVGLEDIDVVLCTHAHPDHIEGVQLLKRSGARFGMHQADWDMVRAMLPQIGMSSQIHLEDFQPDFFLQDGELNIGEIELQVVNTPGHSPGSLCFYWPLHKVLISGDLIFKDGIGRTDLPQGDGQLLKTSIEQVATLPIDHLLPGHGEAISGRPAVESNFKRIGQIYLGYL